MLSGQILDAMITSCENAKTVLRQAAIDPSDRKTLNISMGASVAAEFLGRTPEALSKAEARGRLPAPKTSANGRRYYTVEDLIAIREALGIKMGKLPSERAVVVAVQNFKGGVSKSTTGKHLADYLALLIGVFFSAVFAILFSPPYYFAAARSTPGYSPQTGVRVLVRRALFRAHRRGLRAALRQRPNRRGASFDRIHGATSQALGRGPAFPGGCRPQARYRASRRPWSAPVLIRRSGPPLLNRRPSP